MPVRTVSAIGFAAVTEKINGAYSAGDAKTRTATSVNGDTAIAKTADGVNGTVSLDFIISKHEIGYGDRNTALSGSAKETRTVREHEFAHVGGRKALASSTLLTNLCNGVKVNGKFSLKNTDSQATDLANQASAKKDYESAVEDYINPLIDYFDEFVIHETQRTAGLVGVSSAASVAAMLAAIEYTDPDSGTTNKPSATVIAATVTAIKAGAAKGEAWASKNKAPATVTPLP